MVTVLASDDLTKKHFGQHALLKIFSSDHQTVMWLVKFLQLHRLLVNNSFAIFARLDRMWQIYFHVL